MSAGRRAGWGLLDQALSSATNFAASVVVARQSSIEGFGAFGVAFLLYLVVVGLTRAVAAEPYVVRHSSVRGVRDVASDDDVQVGATNAQARLHDQDQAPEHAAEVRGAPAPVAGSDALGAALACGLLGGVVLVLAGVVLGGVLADTLVPLGVLLPLLMVQDIGRYVRVAQGRARRAAASDAAWVLLLIPAFWLAVGPGDSELRWMTAAWAGAGAFAGLALLGADLLPAPLGTLRWWRAHRDLAGRYVAEFVAGNGARHLSFVAMGAFVGTGAVGAVRAVQVLFGPFNVVLMGAQLTGVPEAVRVRREHPERLRRFGDSVGAALAACALALGVAMLLLPERFGRALFGESWAAGSELVGFQMLAEACAAAVVGSLLVLRALGAAHHSLRARLIVAPLTVLGVVGGAIIGEAQGAMLGLVLAQLVAVVVWRTQVTAACADGADVAEAAR